MSSPLFVLPFQEIPKAKLIPEVLFTILDTSQGPLYTGKQVFAWILYTFGLILRKVVKFDVFDASYDGFNLFSDN